MSYRRKHDGVRRGRSSAKAVAWWMAAMVVVLILAAAEAIVAHTVVLVLMAGAAVAGAYVLGRLQGRAGARGASGAGQLRAERNDLRRQVVKLEADAARHDELVDALEDAAGRPIEAIIATYRLVQRQYKPAAVDKRGRTR